MSGSEETRVGVSAGVCEGCWFTPGEDNGEHEICKATGCACATCSGGRDKVLKEPLPRWTVDLSVTDWGLVDSAMAFRKPNGDVLAVMRSVLCPTCGHVAVMVLADGDVVSYVWTRHGACETMPSGT